MQVNSSSGKAGSHTRTPGVVLLLKDLKILLFRIRIKFKRNHRQVVS
jgi:hypothetical protein